jgi:hypothetical protein
MKKMIVFLGFLMVFFSLSADKMKCDRVGNFSNEMLKCSVSKGGIVYYVDRKTDICFAGVDGMPNSFTMVDCAKIYKRDELNPKVY